MTLHRRHLLTALSTTGMGALAGCPILGDNDSMPKTDPALSEHTTKFAPADGDENDRFGWSVAVSAVSIDDRERVCVRLTPRALNELYIETKDISADSRMVGHSGECALWGDQVDFYRAIPDDQGAPTHRRCWADAYGAPDWFLEIG